MKVLFILTSHDALGKSGKKTGFWLEEFAAPYNVFKDAGAEITLASPKGGMPPIDPNSEKEEYLTDDTRRLKHDQKALAQLENTAPLAEIGSAADYDAIFIPGGHGPVWDLSKDRNCIALLEEACREDVPIGSVCHGPAALRQVRGKDGKPLVSGKSVTGFSNREEEAFGTTNIVPFLVENSLRENGGTYTSADCWVSHVVRDGNLVTGQNPASSRQAGETLLAIASA